MLRLAVQAIDHNFRAVLLYIGIHVSVSSVTFFVSRTFLRPLEGEDPTTLMNTLDIGLNVIDGIAWAIAQCVAFAWIGRNLDKPNWKIATAGESLKRFFGFWLLMDLIGVLTFRFFIYSVNAGADASIVLWLPIFYGSATIPLGAAIMFYQRVGTEEIGQALRTLGHQFPRTLLVVCIAGAGFIFLNMIMLQTTGFPFAMPLISIIDSVLDCFIFSCTWIICMYYREESENDSDIDF